MRWLHSVHVSGAMVLGSLTWVRRFVFRWAPWHGIHWRPAGGKPVQKANSSTFLMGCARAWDVGSMLVPEDVLALCRQALAGQLCCASALGERAWPKSVQNSNGGPCFEGIHDCACSGRRHTALGQLNLAASSRGAKLVSKKHESVQNSNTG